MKKTIITMIAVLIITCMFGCDDSKNENISLTSETESESVMESEPEESRTPPEDVCYFLESPYTVSSKRESAGTVYECIYYFIDETVAGAKVTTTLQSESAAEEYLELLNEDCPYATLDGLTLTHYVTDDDAYYYGYTLEKLKFVLEKAGYEFTVNFDEDEFYGEISEVSGE